jgi:hypothetical protein
LKLKANLLKNKESRAIKCLMGEILFQQIHARVLNLVTSSVNDNKEHISEFSCNFADFNASDSSPFSRY